MTKKGLYIHLPFCKSFCPYCNFPRLFSTQDNQLEIKYINFLTEKITTLNPFDFDTIYLGGGTPNALDNALLEKLLTSLEQFQAVEFTIELNPEFITEKQIDLLVKHRVNRVSIGVQTFSSLAQKALKRFYSFKTIKQKISLFKHKIDNISLDIIFNYPGQTIKDFKTDLKNFLKLKPQHISAYDLIVEECTPLAKLIKENKITLNDEDNSYRCYKHLIKTLTRHNYQHYEISSFARRSFAGKHNLKYWNNEEYVAIGLGATSYLNGQEIVNSRSLKSFFSDGTTATTLSPLEIKQRYLLMGLRKLEGISLKEYYLKFKSSPLVDFPLLTESISDKLLEVKKDYLKLSKKGLYLANIVFAKLI